MRNIKSVKNVPDVFPSVARGRSRLGKKEEKKLHFIINYTERDRRLIN